jgi:microcystin-dependent protein
MVLPSGKVGTGDSISTQKARYIMSAPSDLWIQELLIGLIYGYCDEYVWYQVGTVTVQEAAEVFRQIWESFQLTSSPVGTVLLYAGIAAPSNTLVCDGSNLLRADYPELFAAIGVIYGATDSTHFNIPDCRGRSPIGAGTGSGLSPRTIGDRGGEENHTLTTPEIPSHTHTEGTTVPTVTTTGELPFTGLAAVTGVTGSTGGDGGHNTMHPFIVFNYAIVYTV